jgi:hypothetical protein
MRFLHTVQLRTLVTRLRATVQGRLQAFFYQALAQALYRPDIDLQGLHNRRIGPGWTVLAFIRF